MPATDRSNSRTSIESPRPSATRPSVANSCMTLKMVPTLKKYPEPRSIAARTMMAPAKVV